MQRLHEESFTLLQHKPEDEGTAPGPSKKVVRIRREQGADPRHAGPAGRRRAGEVEREVLGVSV